MKSKVICIYQKNRILLSNISWILIHFLFLNAINVQVASGLQIKNQERLDGLVTANILVQENANNAHLKGNSAHNSQNPGLAISLKIKGEVLSQDSLTPVVNAKVAIYDKNDRELASTFTKKSGAYELVVNRNEVDYITVSKENYISDTVFIQQAPAIEKTEIIKNFWLKRTEEIAPVLLRVYTYELSTALPLGKVNIELIGENGKIIAEGITDESGMSEFELTRNENYELRVSKVNYDGTSIKLDAFVPDESDVLVRRLYLSELLSGSISWVPEFPWPPPKPSSKTEIPNNVFTRCITLSDVDNFLVNALTKNGYDDKSYFLVPATNGNGFALATQLEQIDENAISKALLNRWNKNPIDNSFVFSEILQSLFFSNPGYFRVIVFIVTDVGFVPSQVEVDRQTALSWIDTGFSRFPPALVELPFSSNHMVTALIYEYKLPENSETANLLKPSKYSGKEHLVKSKLWDTLFQE